MLKLILHIDIDESNKENKKKLNALIKKAKEICKNASVDIAVDWIPYKKELDILFGNASFEYLKKMGFYPKADDGGNYDTSLDEIHTEWDTNYYNKEKAEMLKDTQDLSDMELLNIISKEDWYHFQ